MDRFVSKNSFADRHSLGRLCLIFIMFNIFLNKVNYTTGKLNYKKRKHLSKNKR